MAQQRLPAAIQHPGTSRVLHLISSCTCTPRVVSALQGLGLFASRDLERHTMVIEYIGELIRSEVAEARERVYEEQVRNPSGSHWKLDYY